MCCHHRADTSKCNNIASNAKMEEEKKISKILCAILERKLSQPSVALRLNKWATTKRHWWNMQADDSSRTLQRNRVFIYTFYYCQSERRTRIFDVISSQICLSQLLLYDFSFERQHHQRRQMRSISTERIKKQRHASSWNGRQKETWNGKKEDEWHQVLARARASSLKS